MGSLGIMFTNITRRSGRTILSPILRMSEKRTSQMSTSDSAAYDGDGKTTINVLNQSDDQTPINLINTYSKHGFRLSNNLFIKGSILLFPTHVYSWSVYKGIDITPESLLLFDIIVPRIKIVVIGYGAEGEKFDASLAVHLKQKGISCELLPTKHAVTTYNYLACDAVHVAGAFCISQENIVQPGHESRHSILKEKLEAETEWLANHDYQRETLDYRNQRKELRNKGVDDKKEFDP